MGRHLLNMTSVEYMRWLMRDAEGERFFNAEFLSCGGCGGIIIDADRIIFFLFWFHAREENFKPGALVVFCNELLLIT